MHLLLVAKKIKRTGKEVFSTKNSKILKKWVEKFFSGNIHPIFFQILVSRKKNFWLSSWCDWWIGSFLLKSFCFERFTFLHFWFKAIFFLFDLPNSFFIQREMEAGKLWWEFFFAGDLKGINCFFYPAGYATFGRAAFWLHDINAIEHYGSDLG